MQFMDNLDLVVNVPVSFHVVTLDINLSQQVLIKGARVSAFQNKACVFVEILLCGHFTNAELLWAQLGEKKNLDVHIQSQRLCYTKPGCLWVSIWAVRPMAVMHVCICVHCLCACASFSMCMHMHACVCWLPNVESRKRKRLDGWRGCLFIHYPAASVVSGGHGNTCPGPFSTGLFVACFGPAKAFSSHLLCSLLSSSSAFYSFSFGPRSGFYCCVHLLCLRLYCFFLSALVTF